jgi:hypothetical protein
LGDDSVNRPLDESYFEWLYGQVADIQTRVRRRSYWNLSKVLFSTEFDHFLIPNDENRAEEARYDLRREFLRETGLKADDHWMELGCSVLELMVELARLLAFEAGGRPPYWFWRLVENIGLIRFNDARRLPKRHVERILEDVIERRYTENGLGGFFPLRKPPNDQRYVELWYQLNYYVLELEPN